MYLVRYLSGSGRGSIQYGYLDGDQVGSINGDIFGEFARGEIVAPLAEVALLPPVAPSKVLTLGVNFADQLRASGLAAPSLPPLVFKAPSSIIGPGAAIRLPAQSRSVEHGVAPAWPLGAPAAGSAWRRPAATFWATPAPAICAPTDIAGLDLGLDPRGQSYTFWPAGQQYAERVEDKKKKKKKKQSGATYCCRAWAVPARDGGGGARWPLRRGRADPGGIVQTGAPSAKL